MSSLFDKLQVRKKLKKHFKSKGIPIFVHSWINRTYRLIQEISDTFSNVTAVDPHLQDANNALKQALLALERCLGSHQQK